MRMRIWPAILIACCFMGAIGHADDLAAAAKRGDLAAVKGLIAGGADVETRDKEGNTALGLAAFMGHKDVVEFLISHGADVNAKNTDIGFTALSVLKYKGVAEVLIAHGADVNAGDSDGETPLMSTDSKGVAEVLIAHGADVNARDNSGQTPLHYAGYNGRADVMEVLIAHGADVNARDYNGKTPVDVTSDPLFITPKEATQRALAVLRAHGGKTGAELGSR